MSRVDASCNFDVSVSLILNSQDSDIYDNCKTKLREQALDHLALVDLL